MPDARFFFYLICPIIFYFFFFFFNDTATTEIYTLSLHDALPISGVLAVMRGTLLIVGTRILDSPSLGNSVLVNLNSAEQGRDRKSTRLNSSHLVISYAVFCLKKKKKNTSFSHATVHSADTSITIR